MRGIFLTLVFFLFMIWGMRAPFIFMLGYMWVDIFTPQFIAYNFISQIPVSFITGVAVILSVFLIPKTRDSVISFPTIIVWIFSIWITITLLWSEVPEAAYLKWNWAIKTVVMSCLIPLFLRSRNHFDILSI